MFLFVCPLLVSAQPASLSQIDAKITHLLKFAQRITYPSNSFTGFKSPVVIGIVGENPFGDALDKAAQNQTDTSEANRPLSIRHCKNMWDARDAQILYFSHTNDDESLQTQLAAMKNKPTLLVGECPNFLNWGGMVRLRVTNNYTVYDVKLDSMLAAGLRVDPALLKEADSVISFRASALKNFTKYVEFPADLLPSPNSPVVVGILGTDPFCEVLGTILANPYGTPPLNVRHFSKPEDAIGIHLLYLGASRNNSLEQDLSAFKGKSVLLVSEHQNFLDLGGMVRLYPTNYPTPRMNQTIEALAWDVDLDRMQAAKLDIQFKMWKLAAHVRSADRKKSR